MGMTLGDFNGIFFQTGGRNLQTRMLIDFDGNVGIGTISPTATLHNKGTFRLEDLPSGTGQNLVIDKEGNVAIDNSVGIRETQLEKEVTELKARLAQLEAIISKFEDSTKQSTSAKLYQNVPNPFSQATEINFFIPSEASQATLFIYDMQGTQIKKVNLTQRGESKISLQAGTLRAGIYHYALVVDRQEVAMQRMMITD